MLVAQVGGEGETGTRVACTPVPGKVHGVGEGKGIERCVCGVGWQVPVGGRRGIALQWEHERQESINGKGRWGGQKVQTEPGRVGWGGGMVGW